MTSAAASIRYPWEPLHRKVADRLGLPYCPGTEGCPGCSSGFHAGPAAVARFLGVSTTAPLRWRDGGGIPERTADVVVMRVGWHPTEVPGWEAVIHQQIAADAAEGNCAPLDRDDDWIAQAELFPETHAAPALSA